jgi:predicted phage terminase large subunit-like protein
LGRNPDLRIIAGSYSGSWAEALGGDVQRIMDSPEYNAIFPGTRITGQFAERTEAKRTVDYFEVVDHQGFHRAAGRGVGVAGRPADILLVDDPTKNAEEALSESTRESVWQWYLQDLYTRLQQGAGVLVMATRWHTDDLIGRLIEAQGQGGDRWDVHTFPALSEAGEALAPSRFDRQELQRVRATQPAIVWNALYQGNPAPLKGNIFQIDRWGYYGGPGQPQFPRVDEFDLIVQSWDSSFKDAAGSDFCAGQTWGLRGPQRWIFRDGYVLEKMDYPRFKQAVREMAQRHPRASWRLIEDAANGAAVVSELRKQIPGITPVRPEGGKIARAWAASGDQSAGNCFLPDVSIAPWVAGFVHRCALFPANINKPGSDDDIDCFTQMLNWARQRITNEGVFNFYKQEAEALVAAKVAPIDRGQSAATRWFGDDGQRAENPQRLLSRELGRILRRW